MRTFRDSLAVLASGLALAAVAAEGLPKACILDMDLPTGRGSHGCFSDPAAFERMLGGRCETVRASGAELGKPGFLSRSRFELLVVPTGELFPAAAASNLVSFLREGGLLFTCGGYAFDSPCRSSGGGWTVDSVGPLPRGDEAVDLSPSLWFGGRDGGSVTKVSAVAGPDGASGMTVSTDKLVGWNQAIRIAPGLLKGKGVISFMARGDRDTSMASIEVAEHNGSRWLRTIRISEDWREFRLSPADFQPLSGDKVGKGRTGASIYCVDFDSVNKMAFGISQRFAETRRPHSVSIANLKVGEDPRRADRVLSTMSINTRHGISQGALLVQPTQVGMFDPSFRLTNAFRVVAAPEMDGILPARKPRTFDSPLSGYAAIAQLGVQRHGYGPNRAIWRPLLSSYDREGRPRGPVGGLVRHYDGTFKGSSWAMFGADNADLFAAGDDEACAWAASVFDLLLSRRFLHDTTAEYACYRPGEKMKLRTNVANGSASETQCEVRFTLTDERGRAFRSETVRMVARAGTDEPAAVEIPVDEATPDYLVMTAELRCDGKLLDRDRSAVVVWNDSVVAGGPEVRCDGTCISIGGERRFFMGAQTFWAQHRSVTASSPLSFYEDLRQMRESGLRWARSFLPCRNEKELRDSDAVVQLAQKFGIVLYHTPNLFMTRDEKVMSANVERMRQIVERYRNVPGFAVDLCNEPTLEGATSPESLEIQRRWAERLQASVRAVRKTVPVSIGWSQGWSGGRRTRDPLLVSLGCDFTDRHYYNKLTDFVAETKDLDLRALGKPFIIGECGALCHPTIRAVDLNGKGDTPEYFADRLRYEVAHSFGLGAALLSVWHWRNPMEGIFPCGINHATRVPRTAGVVFGEMARVLSRFELVSNPPDVVVSVDDATRMRDGDGRQDLIRSLKRLENELMWWGANWSTLPSSCTNAVGSKIVCVMRPEEFGEKTIRDEVGRRLKGAGARVTRLPSDPDTLETFRVPGKGSTAWVFWNGGNAEVEVSRQGHGLTVGPSRMGYLQVSDDGRLEVGRVF